MIENTLPPTVSLTEISNTWILFTAAIILIVSLVEAWIVTLIFYGGVGFLRKIFPAPQQLVRSHVDYTIMTALMGISYFTTIHLKLDLPDLIIVLLCVGAIYNPFGFILKAINPSVGKSDTFMGKVVVCAGFLPATIGYGYVMCATVVALV